ncbi:MAG: uracil phosphoribosyltransferase [Flavobacteriales bacterium]
MKKIHHLGEARSAIDNYMADLRNVDVQTDRAMFRENIRRVGRAIGLEISKTLDYKEVLITTPLAKHGQFQLGDEVVVITILRAGLPMHEGILDVFPKAENGFISAYRKHDADGSFTIDVGYVACPSLEGKVLILNDPMLATGASFENAMYALKEYGKPKALHLAAVIASQYGVNALDKSFGDDVELWVAAIDPELNEDKYIVPGLGDAGDLCFGPKLQS